MTEIQQLLTEIEDQLQQVELPKQPKELREPIRYTLTNGGKRMRPLLVLLASKIFKEDVSEAIHPAIGVEVFHSFTLLHDDIMDNAPLRRGKETVHRKWNNNVAILSGDVMMVQAVQEICKTESAALAKVLAVFNRTAIEVCEGQQLDMNFETRDDVSIAEYIDMIRLKTAVLLGASLKIGAMIGEAADYQADLMYNFGVNVGIAFQLQDDILDAYGGSDKFGKQKGGDIIANKKTFLMLKALEIANPAQRKELEKWLAYGGENHGEKVEAVLDIYDHLDIRELAKKEMHRYYEKGISSLEKVKGSQKWITELHSFADALMKREH